MAEKHDALSKESPNPELTAATRILEALVNSKNIDDSQVKGVFEWIENPQRTEQKQLIYNSITKTFTHQYITEGEKIVLYYSTGLRAALIEGEKLDKAQRLAFADNFFGE